jgi:hypothetical protein
MTLIQTMTEHIKLIILLPTGVRVPIRATHIPRIGEALALYSQGAAKYRVTDVRHEFTAINAQEVTIYTKDDPAA